MPVLFDAQERFPGGDLSSVPRIRFLMSVDFPPFNFTDQEGRLAGFHVDLVREICAQLKVESKCQVQALPFDELEAALEMGEGEAVISGLATTADLRKSFTFSRPYLLLPARLAVNKAGKFTGSGADALSGKKVGVVGNSRHEQMLKAFFPKARVEGFDGYEPMYEALKTGKVDAIFADGLRLPFWVSGGASESCCALFGGPYMSDRFLGEGLSIMAVDPDNILVPAFDQALAALSRNGRLEEIYRRYFPYGLY
ncbi:transporter substrate-binding domain-containing protein [Agrobacterium fabrum]|uniref:ABC transporter, substrate binding protein (Amino acid) n=2 Tax=Agrobacterium fabrum TaxID=1176649 RepID=Q7D1E1_AGRFC|nr:transporter substrate-binding domain-containing protein [Agrobacterium fabrum]KEY54894.1 amino acid ABC transporter [Agrobacterium tumefaciens]AAK86292.2 ABC transporter, substrate binding protein (amino acid) [Agrobacterium fabrum str. C58]MCR6723342.1 transporter substrate-binding domain-containing protein [Agrobacterium fabrum]MCX2877370.1 transporter substrate-binding domain-containing protein [Agrobacterium fabrum]NMV68830.1 transporter substrate-binding domain-containing protein [Agro